MIISERLVQSEKALLPILITLFGIVMLFKLVHLQKVPTSIRFTLFGITISVRLVQSENAYLEILFVSCLNSIFVFLGISPLYVYATLPAYTTPSD